MRKKFCIDELKQYSRHTRLQNVGLDGQRRLKEASVLVVGAGGLGCPALMYLAAAGVGKIGIVEDDVVDVSNLHRQVLYTRDDVGQSKLKVAARRLREINQFVEVVEHPVRLSQENIKLVQKYQIILDATDNFGAKYLINDACLISGLPLIYASISQFEGQMAVFDMCQGVHQRAVNLRDIFPEPPPSDLTQSCSEAGVLGVLPGILGVYQAAEVIKFILGFDDPSRNHLLLFNMIGNEFKRMQVRPRLRKPLQQGTEGKDIGGCQVDLNQTSVSPEVLAGWFKERKPLLLIDVRQSAEHVNLSLGGELWPDGVPSEAVDWPTTLSLAVVYCKSGVRSQRAVGKLRSEFPHVEFLSLAGGLDAYVDLGCVESLQGEMFEKSC